MAPGKKHERKTAALEIGVLVLRIEICTINKY